MSRARGARLALILSLASMGPFACSSPDSAVPASQPSQSPSAAAPPAAAQPQSTGRPHGSHDPQHGGLVLMDRDLHFEVVLRPEGDYRVYFTDEVRKPLPASTVSDVVVSISCEGEPPEMITLAMDQSGESWKGAPEHPVHDSEATVRVSYVYRDAPYWIDIPIKALQNPPATAGHDDPAGTPQH